MNPNSSPDHEITPNSLRLPLVRGRVEPPPLIRGGREEFGVIANPVGCGDEGTASLACQTMRFARPLVLSVAEGSPHPTGVRQNPASGRSGFAQRGVVLLEAMIAILIFSMGVLAVVGLQAAMIKNTSASKSRADASYIAQQRIGQMWADSDNLNNYLEPAPGTDISNLLPNGTRTVVQTAAGQFQVTITWQEPGEAAHQFVTVANIQGN